MSAQIKVSHAEAVMVDTAKDMWETYSAEPTPIWVDPATLVVTVEVDGIAFLTAYANLLASFGAMQEGRWAFGLAAQAHEVLR